MSDIIEIEPGRYHYKDWNGVVTEIRLWNICDNSTENFKGFEVNGKYGIIKNDKQIIADAVYDEIKCNYNRRNKEINFFEYKINICDENGNEFKVFGQILKNGTIVQDARLKSKYEYDKKYSLLVPNRFVFICWVFGCYYLYYDKYGYYGMLIFDIELQPSIIGKNGPYFSNTFNFKSFLFNDKWKPCICFYKEERETIPFAKSKECTWFIYSYISKEGRYIKEYDSIEKVWPTTQEHFWWFKLNDCYGVIDPFLKIILPPKYKINNRDFTYIDFIVASNNDGMHGVFQLAERKNLSSKGNDTLTIDSYRKYEYLEYIPFKYYEIRRDGGFLTLSNFDGFQCIYSIQKHSVVTDFVFSYKWVLYPSTIGENLIGACLKGHEMWRCNESPDLKNVFLDLDTGEVVIKLNSNIWITNGFTNGRACIENTDGEKYTIDRNGNMYKRKSRQIMGAELEPEEYWNPYGNEFSEEEIDMFYGETDGMNGDLW